MTLQSQWLRDQVRSGKLDPLTYSTYVWEIYRLERVDEGLPHVIGTTTVVPPKSAEAVAATDVGFRPGRF